VRQEQSPRLAVRQLDAYEWLILAHSHVLLEAGFEDSHGSQTTRSHGNIRKLVGGTMGSNSEEMGAG
jgi:hypothetical protein